MRALLVSARIIIRAVRRIASILAGSYLALAAICIGYELSIRLFDRGNSEFAGMLSFALTLPGVLAIVSVAGLVFGCASATPTARSS